MQTQALERYKQIRVELDEVLRPHHGVQLRPAAREILEAQLHAIRDRHGSGADFGIAVRRLGDRHGFFVEVTAPLPVLQALGIEVEDWVTSTLFIPGPSLAVKENDR